MIFHSPGLKQTLNTVMWKHLNVFFIIIFCINSAQEMELGIISLDEAKAMKRTFIRRSTADSDAFY